MKIYVYLKTLRNVSKKVQPCAFYLENTPRTVGELICEAVQTCVCEYGARAKNAEVPRPISEEDFEGMREVGKFAFGVHYNENKVDLKKAKENALQAYEDGLVRIFHGEKELGDAGSALDLREGDELTFVRLAMLAGRMW